MEYREMFMSIVRDHWLILFIIIFSIISAIVFLRNRKNRISAGSNSDSEIGNTGSRRYSYDHPQDPYFSKREKIIKRTR